MQMPASLNIADIIWGPVDTNLVLVPEDTFFADRARGIVRPGTVPCPDGVSGWYSATLSDVPIHAARVEGTLYMLADTYIFGYALFKFVSSDDDTNTFRAAYQGSVRLITNERDVSMSVMTDLSKMYGSRNPSPVAPMNLSGQQGPQQYQNVPAPAHVPMGEGVSRGPNLDSLRSQIQMRGYVAGYIMAGAPAVTMSCVRKRSKDGTQTANIVAKESKPSKCLRVLMALPASCVTRNGSLASVDDINAGAVDYDTSNSEMLKLSFSVPATIAYLSAFNNRLPEYAPNVTDMKKQWTPEQIASESDGVTFVYLYPVVNSRNRNGGVDDQFRWVLKSTSPRNSLYTQRNIMCLRALTHIPVSCKTEEDAYRMNENAFRPWMYRMRKTETRNALMRACDDAPSQIWVTQYNIDGKTVDGIGSCFFMAGSSAKSASGETIALKEPTYQPWWKTGNLRDDTPHILDRIVKRKVREAKDNLRESMVTEPVLFREDPGNPLFAPYARFVEQITSEGYISMDRLCALGTRTARARAKTLNFSAQQRSSLVAYIGRDDVASEIAAVQHESSDRAAVLAARASMSAR